MLTRLESVGINREFQRCVEGVGAAVIQAPVGRVEGRLAADFKGIGLRFIQLTARLRIEADFRRQGGDAEFQGGAAAVAIAVRRAESQAVVTGAERHGIDQHGEGRAGDRFRSLIVHCHGHTRYPVIRDDVGHDLQGFADGLVDGREVEYRNGHRGAQSAAAAHCSPGCVHFQFELPDAAIQRHVHVKRYVVLGPQQVGQAGINVIQFLRRRRFAEESVGVRGNLFQICAVRAIAEPDRVYGHTFHHGGQVRLCPVDPRSVLVVIMHTVTEQNDGAARIVDGGRYRNCLQCGVVEQRFAAIGQAVDYGQQFFAVRRESLDQVDSG